MKKTKKKKEGRSKKRNLHRLIRNQIKMSIYWQHLLSHL